MDIITLISSYQSDFLNYLRLVKKYSPATLTAYNKDLNLLKSYLERDTNMAKSCDQPTFPRYLTKEQVSGFFKDLFYREYQQNSIYRIRCSLASFFNYLISKKVIVNSPLDNLFSLKRKQQIPNFINASRIKEISQDISQDISHNLEVEQKLNSSTTSLYRKKRDQLIWEFLYGLGLRISEMSNLTLQHIDFNQKQTLIHGKGGSINLLPLTPKLIKLLNDYLLLRKTFIASKGREHDHLLVNHLGDPITVRGVRYAFMHRLKKIKVQEKVYPHLLRHSIATHLLENGADIKRVQQLLRHKSIETTQIYTHLSKKMLRKSYLQFHPLASKDDN